MERRATWRPCTGAAMFRAALTAAILQLGRQRSCWGWRKEYRCATVIEQHVVIYMESLFTTRPPTVTATGQAELPTFSPLCLAATRLLPSTSKSPLSEVTPVQLQPAMRRAAVPMVDKTTRTASAADVPHRCLARFHFLRLLLPLRHTPPLAIAAATSANQRRPPQHQLHLSRQRQHHQQPQEQQQPQHKQPAAALPRRARDQRRKIPRGIARRWSSTPRAPQLPDTIHTNTHTISLKP